MAAQSDPDDILEVEWVTPEIIRQIFNENNLPKKAADGQIKQRLARNAHPELPPKREPYCTHSQIVFYYDENYEFLAVVHQYMRPDGSIGASGLPDPKKLVWNNRIYATR
jgi:hypothetical protein